MSRKQEELPSRGICLATPTSAFGQHCLLQNKRRPLFPGQANNNMQADRQNPESAKKQCGERDGIWNAERELGPQSGDMMLIAMSECGIR